MVQTYRRLIIIHLGLMGVFVNVCLVSYQNLKQYNGSEDIHLQAHFRFSVKTFFISQWIIEPVITRAENVYIDQFKNKKK